MWRSRTRTYCPNCFERYAPGDRACGRCGRVRDLKTLAEMAAEADTWQRYIVWLWPVAGVFFLLFIALLIMKPQSASKPRPVVALPPPTPEERTRIAKQKAIDTKFWAAKERSEAREVDSYYTTLQVPPSPGGAAAIGASPSGEAANGSEDIPSRAILGAGVEMRSVPYGSAAPRGGGAPSSPPQGTRGVSL